MNTARLHTAAAPHPATLNLSATLSAGISAGISASMPPALQASAVTDVPPTAFPTTVTLAQHLAELRSLQGRVVLITEASQAPGTAIAQVLGESGLSVVLADIDGQRVQDRAAVLSERGIRAMPLALDVTDTRQCADAVAAVVRRFGRLDALIHNGAADLCHHASAQMLTQDSGGHIIHLVAGTTSAEPAWPHTTPWQAPWWTSPDHAPGALAVPARERPVRLSTVATGAPKAPPLQSGSQPTLDEPASRHRQDSLHVARAVRYVLQQPADPVAPDASMPAHS